MRRPRSEDPHRRERKFSFSLLLLLAAVNKIPEGVLIGFRAEGLSWADLVARTPIGVRGNFVNFFFLSTFFILPLLLFSLKGLS